VIENYRGLLGTLVKEYPMLEIAMVHHRNTRGEPIGFADKPYLIELYSDVTKMENWVIRKCVQTGFSEWAIQFSLMRSGWNGRIVSYVLPTYTARDGFVQKRMNPILQEVPAYRERVGGSIADGNSIANGSGSSTPGKKGIDNLRLKRFGRGSMLFLGSNTATDFLEFSADVLIIDEYDHCDMANIAKARDRIRASPYAQMLRIGNPTLPRVGISRLYDESDGRRWFQQCANCKTRQPLDWFLNVIERDDDGTWVPRDRKRWLMHKGSVDKITPDNDIRPVCVKCKTPWERRVDGALWVAERPQNRHMRGYTCSRMDVMSEPMMGLFREWVSVQGNPTMLGTFYTSALGIPFEFEGAKLSSADLEAVCTGDAMDYAGGESYDKMTVVAGVDVGSVLHVTVDIITGYTEAGDPIREARMICTTRTFEEVADILQRYRVTVCVIDSQPEMHKAQELRDWFLENGNCAVWLARFVSQPKAGAQRYGLKLDYASQVANVDRTALMDIAYEDIRTGRRAFPMDSWSVLGWSEQMRAPVRVLDEEKQRVTWVEGNAADHYRLSDTYARLACDLLQGGGSYSAL
jgi:hypothetical protein